MLCLVLAAPAFADDGALARSFALPALGQVQVNAIGATRYTIELDLTNEYVSKATPAESLLLDGETARLGFNYYGVLAPGWDWNSEMPVYLLGGGFMDRFISGYHDAFGLPDGGRGLAQDDQYHYRYTRGGVTLLDASHSGAFVGDMTFGIGWQALPQVALRAQVKLPTGKAANLTGGNSGGAFWADIGLPFAEGSPLSGYVSAGVSYNSRGDVLNALQEQTLFFGGGGLRFRASDAISFYAQVSARSALFTGSEFEPLDGVGVPALFGMSFELGPRYSMDLAFQEDLNPGASPDFGLRLALRTH